LTEVFRTRRFPWSCEDLDAWCKDHLVTLREICDILALEEGMTAGEARRKGRLRLPEEIPDRATLGMTVQEHVLTLGWTWSEDRPIGYISFTITI
jgi:hypothetical protein